MPELIFKFTPEELEVLQSIISFIDDVGIPDHINQDDYDSLFNKVLMMHDSTLDLFCNSNDEIFADEYAMELEEKASSLEITVDYYLMEFV